ncbi:MAG: hypothetical protein Q4D61_06895 [Cardiobacteriaceae bacterium]|nr:hypothetical protein [Cardiobacteriaceae bacterium]
MKKPILLALLLASHTALAADAITCDRLREPLEDDSFVIIHEQPDAILPAMRDACEAALKADPDNPQLLYQTGMAYHLLARHKNLRTLARGEPLPQPLSPSALAYWQRAADNGHPAATYWLARLTIYKGRGGNREKIKNELETLLTRDARFGHLGLGNWYRVVDGEGNSHRDAAQRHYREAAALGSREGELEAILLTLYEPATRTTALAQLDTLAHSGYLPALERLGEYHFQQHNDSAFAAVIATLDSHNTLPAATIADYLQGLALSRSADSATQAQGRARMQNAARHGHSRAQTLLAVESDPWW